MSLELYFLRSSEQKIVKDMLYYAQKIDKTNKTLLDFSHLNVYHEFYGLTSQDAGVYAMQDATVAGAIWCRRINDELPIITLATKPEFRNQGIATALIKQFLQVASTLYETLSIAVVNNEKEISFFKKFGFEVLENSQHLHAITQENSLLMVKKLEKTEVKTHDDEFASCKWLD
ncbi:GNAT family N-acetyltransferase [Sulfurimonas sp.]